MCANSLAALFFDTYINTRLKNSSSRLRFPSNAVGPMSSAMYFHNCGMSISKSSAKVNICSTLKRDHKKEIIRVKMNSAITLNFSKICLTLLGICVIPISSHLSLKCSSIDPSKYNCWKVFNTVAAILLSIRIFPFFSESYFLSYRSLKGYNCGNLLNYRNSSCLPVDMNESVQINNIMPTHNSVNNPFPN